MLKRMRKRAFRRLLPIVQASFFTFGLIVEVASRGSRRVDFLDDPLSWPYNIALNINAPAILLVGFPLVVLGLVLGFVDSHAGRIWFTPTGNIAWVTLNIIALSMVWYLVGRWIDRRLKWLPVERRPLSIMKKVLLSTLLVVLVAVTVWVVIPEGGGGVDWGWSISGLSIALWSIFGAIVVFRLLVQEVDGIVRPRVPGNARH